jgi:hypothetical protein
MLDESGNSDGGEVREAIEVDRGSSFVFRTCHRFSW